MFMDLKLGTRTYVATEEGVDDIHRPDLLAKLQAALPNAVKPEYAQKFTRKMFADIRASESSTGALSFRIGVSIKYYFLLSFFLSFGFLTFVATPHFTGVLARSYLIKCFIPIEKRRPVNGQIKIANQLL